MNPELIFKILEIGETIAQQLLTHFQDLQSAARTNDQATLDAIRVRLDAAADALARPPT
jgi:hypothetical protein